MALCDVDDSHPRLIDVQQGLEGAKLVSQRARSSREISEAAGISIVIVV